MDSRLQKQGYGYLLWWLWVSGPQPAGQMARSSTSIIYLIVCFRIAALLLYSKKHCPTPGEESGYNANHQSSNYLSHRSSERLN